LNGDISLLYLKWGIEIPILVIYRSVTLFNYQKQVDLNTMKLIYTLTILAIVFIGCADNQSTNENNLVDAVQQSESDKMLSVDTNLTLVKDTIKFNTNQQHVSKTEPDKIVSQKESKETTYLFSGRVEESSIVHGGVYEENRVPPSNLFTPYAYCTFIIIRENDNKEGQFFSKVITDALGNFKVSLPKGKYGIWPGAKMPDNTKSVFEGMPEFSENSGENIWSINIPVPIIIEKDISDVVIRNQYDGYAP
jgi:hypothetical protein